MAHFNLVARFTGVGLDRDVELVGRILEQAGHRVTRSHARGCSPLRQLWPGAPSFDVNVFFERVFQRWLGAARVQCLIPNQERFPRRHLGRLARINHVLCKTRHAVDVFSAHHASVRHIGFSSPDAQIAGATPDYHRPFHLAGRSTLKGTDTLLAVWARHPEWPTLTLVQHPDNAPKHAPANVAVMRQHVADDALRRLQNEHGLHLCPSLAEGWGHYIVEAMACGAVTVTTDAPPMNELVTAKRGLLVTTDRHEARHLGTSYTPSADALEHAIDSVLHTPAERLRVLGVAGREWYEDNDRRFRVRLAATLDVLSPNCADH